MSKLQESLVENPNWESVCYFGYYQIFIGVHDHVKTPNFHIVDIKTIGKKFHCQVYINKARYVKGETTKLSNLDVTLLGNVLQYHYCKNGYSFWQLIAGMWNENNKQKVNVNKESPNYFKLNERC